jgi:excisionase family DNA binding protein
MTTPLRRQPSLTGQLLTPAEVADLLSVSEAWVRRQAAAHQVPCTRLGRQVRFTPEQVQQIVDAAEQPVAQLPAYGLTRRSSRRRAS